MNFYREKESHHFILSNTIMPHIARGVEKLMNILPNSYNEIVDLIYFLYQRTKFVLQMLILKPLVFALFAKINNNLKKIRIPISIQRLKNVKLILKRSYKQWNQRKIVTPGQ